MDTAYRSATELAEALRAREIGSRELTELYLARIGSSVLNAVVTVDAQGALEQAAARDAEPVRGPLHGLPMTVKDALAVAGMRSTGGAEELADHVPGTDAPVVAALREAGAVIVGKTNVPRWSTDLQTSNTVFGTTRNPWDPERTPGGSSGGAAAAVAAGLTSVEVGTDLGGSIRIPSHFCGVFGLKPSYGLVPSLGYLDHVGGGATAADVNVVGPIARSAQDLDLLLGVLAGPSPRHRPAWRVSLPAPDATRLDGLRVAFWGDLPGLPVDPEYGMVLRRVADVLSDAGALLTTPAPPVDVGGQIELYHRLLDAAVSPALGEGHAEAIAGGHRDWLRSQSSRAGTIDAWTRWFDGFDVLLCPVTFTTAFGHDDTGSFATRRLGERYHRELVDWPGLIGVVELPSAVAPVGTVASGMPAGVQVVAPFLQDRRAVAVAGLVAEACGGGYRVPPHS
ncbi:amidase family protein [Pseudonocardia endophytica]|uniref:Amidase n=1 Tax=Pseudonocardia endophytica TaxID=401976 RepID=A0A4R1HU17_PSEEN|nr:amidase family protein [Pseudonocardia endophytica]TCK26167.1 amidase [Pseudonocardia endophytica]